MISKTIGYNGVHYFQTHPHGFWFGCDIKQIEKVARLTYCFHVFCQSIYCLSGQIDANYIRHFTRVRHSQRQLCVCSMVTMNSFYMISDILIGFSNSISIWLVVSNIFYFPFRIWDVILPIDELHHFSRWLKHVKTQIIIPLLTTISNHYIKPLLTIINHILTIY